MELESGSGGLIFPTLSDVCLMRIVGIQLTYPLIILNRDLDRYSCDTFGIVDT